jgi:hypothetical protein
MRNKKGFSLLSFLLYLMLFTMITFFSCHIILSLIVPSLLSMRRCQSVIALHIASDIFVRDVRAGIHNWKVTKPHELVWQAGDHDIGWCFTDNRLERNTGMYDKGWKSKKASIVATGIAEVVFTIEKANEQGVGIEMVIIQASAQKKPIVCYVAVAQKGTI